MAERHIMNAPEKVDIAITGKCNLTCSYCYYADEMVSRGDLSTETWLNFFDQLGELGVMRVNLSGGELFTRRDLWQLIDRMIANRLRYSMNTNGTFITEETIEQWNTGKRRTRLDSVQISLDGSSADVHNASRPKSFERTVRGLRLLVKHKYPVTVRVTINRHNYEDLDNIARLLLDDIGLSGFSTNEAYPCGATSRAEELVRLNREQRTIVMAKLMELNEKYDGRLSATAGPLSYAQSFKQIDEALAKGITELPGRGKLNACGGVFNTMAVLHDGSIVPCQAVPTLTMGNIKSQSFVEVWQQHTIMQEMRARRDIPLGKLETCKGCKYQGFCTGGCPVGAIAVGQGLDARNPFSCFRVLRGEDPNHFDEVQANEVFEPTRIDIPLGGVL